MRIRPERVAERIHRETAEILERRLRDPRVPAGIGITDVEVTQDLSLARIYFSLLGSDQARQEALVALQRAAGFVRSELAPRLGLREMPEIRFVLDESLQRGARVDELLRRLERGEQIPDEDLEA